MFFFTFRMNKMRHSWVLLERTKAASFFPLSPPLAHCSWIWAKWEIGIWIPFRYMGLCKPSRWYVRYITRALASSLYSQHTCLHLNMSTLSWMEKMSFCIQYVLFLSRILIGQTETIRRQIQNVLFFSQIYFKLTLSTSQAAFI